MDKKKWVVVLLIVFSISMMVSPLSYKECAVIGINREIGWATFQAGSSDGNAVYSLNLNSAEISTLVPGSSVRGRWVVQAEDLPLIGVMEILEDDSGRLDVYSIEDGHLIFHYEAPESLHISEFSSRELMFYWLRSTGVFAVYRIQPEVGWEVTESQSIAVTSFVRPPLELSDLQMLAQYVPACSSWSGYSRPSSKG